MDTKKHRAGVAGPLILIGIGVLLLLNQTGRVPWDIWGALWRLWPVVFILIGVDILVSASRSTLVYVLGVLVALAIIGGCIACVVWQGGVLPTGRPAPASEAISEAMQDAERGRISLKPGVARLQVGSLSDSPNFVEGRIEYGQYSLQADEQHAVSGGSATFTLRARSNSEHFWTPGDHSERWELNFTPRVPIEISVDSGVGAMSLDLTDLRVTRLDVHAGVGSTTITFPKAAGTTQASIEAGIGSVTVRIPSNVGVRLRVSRGLGSVSVAGRMARSGNDFVSDNYSTAENRLELDIDGGIGSISVQ